ncbi:hypothetical protein B9T33_04040 [Acinetobacter sp. ANC 5054]|uniref:hypothetical protein n=1 Tax=Acinetobacter sp. ANC 5054 TaxID=1977877 RepID=UPI000A33E660|nr:hypothetical protein [Acinetobacter sp. ANC 5054]OTG82628.1 hypothetical protein B9T33_04040 [Acinetobacter sp. ANC 5054]
MKFKLALAVLMIAPLTLTACAKKEQAPAAGTEASSVATDDVQTSPEQQKAIDALDKPVLDEKNQDVPAELANAPADEATAHAETEASAAATH